jgi:hypothetical protein
VATRSCGGPDAAGPHDLVGLVLLELGDEGVDALIVHDDGVAPSSLTVIQTASSLGGRRRSCGGIDTGFNESPLPTLHRGEP